jgi:hypothetical protein
MALGLSGWDMHDIGVKMRDKTVFHILGMYKDKVSEINTKSLEYMQAFKDKNEIDKERIEKECNHLEKEKCVIALRIADEFTKEIK